MLFKTILTLLFVLAPATLYAWGPLTHVYLGTEVFYFASLLPAGLYSLLKKHRQDFLYGNIMADMVLAKKYMSQEKHSHNWNAAFDLQRSAGRDSELAFALGYSSHLAADTVAHGDFTFGARNITHALMEAWVDRSLGGKYWLSALSISPSVQRRNDAFLESVYPERVFLRHSTNRRIFKGIVALTGLNSKIIKPGLTLGLSSKYPEIGGLLKESTDRMLDMMRNGYSSEVIGMNPIADLKPSPVMKHFVG
jgi:hypothetical protein